MFHYANMAPGHMSEHTLKEALCHQAQSDWLLLKGNFKVNLDYVAN